MNAFKNDNLLAGVLLTLSVALSIAWLSGWVVNDGWWPIRAMVLAVAIGIAATATLVLQYHRRRDSQLAEKYFNDLWQLDTQAIYEELNSDKLASLPAGNAWSAIANKTRDTILRLCERIRELEDLRTSLEVRCQRATAQTERLQRILDGLADPVLAIDDYDELVLTNPSAEGLLQIDSHQTDTKALTQLVHCQKLVQLLMTTRQRKAASQRTDEIEIADAQGQSHWYRATAVKLAGANEDAGGKGIGAVAVLRDIGDQKALQKRNAEFVSSVSHEMKTPLAGIKAYVELLADGDAEDEETREEFLGVINSQADRLQRLVDNLLNLARIEAGVVNVSKRSRSLNELLDEALRVVQPSAEAKQIQLVSELSPLYLGALVDRDMLLQAAINLLSNAIKYTRNGGKVTLRSRLEDEQVRFEVQDTGVGLSEEDCHRVFEKFYRVKKDKDMATGTGLGLPLAKHIVEDVHGGKLHVESVLGQGSTFVVTLPAGVRD